MVGIVLSGAGVDCKIMPGHNSVVKQAVGFIPYPGTLNVRLDDWLTLPDPIATSSLLCLYPIKLNGLLCYMMARHGSHKNGRAMMMAVISPYCLRDKFNLKDGDTVNVEVVK